nr:MAG TPA: hypothetical protein [Caudoviricetes sp.]
MSPLRTRGNKKGQQLAALNTTKPRCSEVF